MTDQRRPEPPPLLSPARRGRPTQTPEPAPREVDEVELAHGQAAAVLGALGRLQLRLELLAREQNDAFALVQKQLIDLERRVAELTQDHDAHTRQVNRESDRG